MDTPSGELSSVAEHIECIFSLIGYDWKLFGGMWGDAGNAVRGI